MSDNEQDELDKLLGELANTEPLSPGKDDDVIVPAVPRQKINVQIVEEDDLPFATLEETKSDDLSTVFTAQLQKVASQYGSVFEEIISNYKKDREQAQEVIDQFMDVIAMGGKVPRVYLEKVADAVRAKNEIAQTAIKALDSLPKLISATKGNDMFTNNVGVSFDAKNLKAILEAAKEDE
jgi:hypothetical protein